MKILDITAVMINMGPVEPLIQTMDETLETIKNYFEFKHYVIITDKNIVSEKYEIKKSDVLTSENYNMFHIKDLWKYIETPHFLILHTDGFIINPKAWDDKWLEYDYIGCPWGNGDVGGGGFSLRSTKLAKYMSEKFGNTELTMNEDMYYSGEKNNPDFKYPSKFEALKFGQEQLLDIISIPFGIHGHKCQAFRYWNSYRNSNII
jgi:hypothetical protein